MGSRDINFITSSFSEDRSTISKKTHSKFIGAIEIFSRACVFALEFVDTTRAKCRNEYTFRKLNA